MSYRAYYEDVFAMAEEVAGSSVVNEQLRADQDTFHHQIATGAMVAEVLALHDFDGVVGRLGALAGAFHDVGKYHSEIQELMVAGEGRAFSDEERALMATHARRGYESISGLDRKYKPELELAAFTALHHHDQFDASSYRKHGGFAGVAHLVQLCDVGHARLMDRSRTYRPARDGGQLTAEVIGRQMLEQFALFPPRVLGTTIRVEEVIHRWQCEAETSQ